MSSNSKGNEENVTEGFVFCFCFALVYNSGALQYQAYVVMLERVRKKKKLNNDKGRLIYGWRVKQHNIYSWAKGI